MEALLPCPFCGGRDVLLATSNSGASVECQECLAEGPFVHGPGFRDRAEEAWNRRPAPPPPNTERG